MVIQSIPIYIQGNESNTSLNGSTISYHFSPPVIIGDLAKATLRVHTAEIWHTFPNIDAVSKNNKLDYIYNTNPRQITFQDGLYNLASINSNLRDFFIQNGEPEDLFVFTADVSTGKVSIEMNYGVTAVNFDPALDSIGQILGWNVATTPTTTVTENIFEAPEKASLNKVNRVLLHANFCSGAYLNSRGGADVLSSIQIDVGPGRQIKFEPTNLVGVDVFSRHISEAVFYITDENNNLLQTNGEYWSATCVLTIEE